MLQKASQPIGEPLIPGVSPQLYAQADFDKISTIVRGTSGVVLSSAKRMLVYSRIAPLVRKSGATTFGEFLATAESDPVRTEEIVEALTTNHTYFYREPHHYEHFEQVVRPSLIARAESGEPVRLWSAACSSGEEIWTLLMVLLGEDQREGRRLAKRDILALGCDLADRAIAAACEALYPADDLKAIPKALRAPWHEDIDGTAHISKTLRDMVRFRRLNLLGTWPFSTQFDVVFCRNVMIYFDGPTKEDLLCKLTQHVRPGGYLYIGHSERVSGEASRFLEPVGQTVYLRKPS